VKKRIATALLSCLFVSTVVSAEGFTLSSPDISGQISNQQVFFGFGCSGKNISPVLHWDNPPAGTKSFAVTAYDPDAPTGGGWWHWVMFDIPPAAHELASNSGADKTKAPAGSIQSINSFGGKGFGGACPPKGDRPHRYVFTIYAMKIAKLGLDESATPSLVGYYLGANSLARASLIAYYSR